MARIPFISLFVPDLADASAQFAAVLGQPSTLAANAAPNPHPFAAKGPVVFQLGDVALALYECDQSTTHPGDVGIGLECGLTQAIAALQQQGAAVFFGPRQLAQGCPPLAVAMLPSRHFFELVEPQPSAASAGEVSTI